MNKSHLRAYTKALVESAMNRQTALEIELAVGFAVMLECADARRLARETMLTIYNGAGWQCSKPGTLDWRSVNRRITAAIALYDFVGTADVQKLAEGKKAAELVDAFRPMIAALKVKSVNEVLLACDKVRAPRKPSSEHSGVRIDAGHLHFTIPPNATRDDLIAMAAKLMTMAQELFDRPTAAQPENAEAETGETV
jgi:hypothetical protein